MQQMSDQGTTPSVYITDIGLLASACNQIPTSSHAEVQTLELRSLISAPCLSPWPSLHRPLHAKACLKIFDVNNNLQICMQCI